MNQRIPTLVRQACIAALLITASCSSGGGSRTVSGAFDVTHWVDDGSKTTVREALPGGADYGPVLKAIHVPDDSPTGYTTRAVSVDANQAFAVDHVPAGSYFVELNAPRYPCCVGSEAARAFAVSLIEQRADTPDFSRITAARADLTYNSEGESLQDLNLSGLDPWASGDQIRIASAQGKSYSQLYPTREPAAGATTYDGAHWLSSEGFPDASKGDSVYIYQRSAHAIGSGDSATTVQVATRYVRKTDLTAVPGGSATDVALAAVPQTGSVHIDFRYSQFAALRAQVHPNAFSPPLRDSSVLPTVVIGAVPRSVSHPEMPMGNEQTSLFRLIPPPATDRDVDYGTLQYGEFLDSSWKSYRTAAYWFEVDPPMPGGGVGLRDPLLGLINSQVPLSEAGGAIVPVLGPPTAPRIEGRDAFAGQSGVGLQPTISWSPPTLGSATSYQIAITRVSKPASGEMQELSVKLYSGTRFRIPPGFLKAGALYSTIITARSAPWDVGDHPPYRTGVPLHTADCILGVFTP